MNILSISLSYLHRRWANTLLNATLLAFGIGIIVFLLLLQAQVEEKFKANIKGIKMVIGAKGSPLQLILCNVYHIDYPTGNIALADAERIARNRRMVKASIPLALGDSYKGCRIVGTTTDFAAHYRAQTSRGKLWQQTMDCTLGAEAARTLGLRLGDTFAGAHGLEDSDLTHAEHKYKVVGILAPTGAAIDKLILTNVESVWQVHDTHTPQDTTTAPPREITALLITQYANPIAAINLPRMVNQIGNLQAAQPAVEITRLLELLGIGGQILQAFAGVLILMATLSIFIALYNALRERKYDLALMRALGASRRKLFLQTLLEGILLAALGTLLGVLVGHGAIGILGGQPDVADKILLTPWIWLSAETYLLGLIFGVGIIAALIPAWQAYHTEVAQTLAE